MIHVTWTVDKLHWKLSTKQENCVTNQRCGYNTVFTAMEVCAVLSKNSVVEITYLSGWTVDCT